VHIFFGQRIKQGMECGSGDIEFVLYGFFYVHFLDNTTR